MKSIRNFRQYKSTDCESLKSASAVRNIQKISLETDIRLHWHT